MSSLPAETGTQIETTALAWQRTALSVAMGSVVTARLAYDRVGVLALANLLLALPLALSVFAESRSRYRHRARIVVRRRTGVGLESALLCGAALVLGAVELVAVIFGPIG